ncbi:hypothetical protein HL658_20975 [Azospirillum sp. RWY-5-1]|uniref:Uncharacterized protein n=1 Tax=Azospirillum oleiclasticum TaxID=2735135 RepID=A0ABX2TI88_9PROT|nr:hypothetical protein [Azospirillum oleiclasticum]NYZ15027.1 hypothetical protein [Azospirillum oleiclasticum]NYZ22789.1 hypothetical protein [Azospirillum oleiclasticum]
MTIAQLRPGGRDTSHDEGRRRCRCLRIAIARAREAERRLLRRRGPGVVAAMVGKVVFTVTLTVHVMFALFRLQGVLNATFRRSSGEVAHAAFEAPFPGPRPAPPPSRYEGTGTTVNGVPRHRMARAFRKYAAWKAAGDTISRGGIIIGRTGTATRPPPEVRFLPPTLLAAVNAADKATLGEWSVAGDAIIRQLPAIERIGAQVLLALPTAGKPEVGPPRDVLRLLGIIDGHEAAAPDDDGGLAVPDVHGEGRQ